MLGIVSFGAYIPLLRLQRQSIVQANSWFDPSLKAHASGQRAMCNFDEDALTMAVEAARDCLTGTQTAVTDVHLASTSLPFASRLNSSIVSQALNLDECVGAMDITASLRGATSALINALQGTDSKSTLLIASDRRKSRVASTQELTNGDASAAVLVGSGSIIAQVLSVHSLTVDMADQYRGALEWSDHQWEERWIRDEGVFKLIPGAITTALGKAHIEPTKVDRLCIALTGRGLAQKIAKSVGVDVQRLQDNLAEKVGYTGAAHPLLMLADALGRAQPQQVIVLAAFGQGVDVIVLRTTEALSELPARQAVAGWLSQGCNEENYMKFLAFNDLLALDKGMRAEQDKLTPLSLEYRHRQMLHGFVGGRCKICSTAQFPKTDVCVNPNCGAVGEQESLKFADRGASIMTYTADRLAFSMSPPACYGMVQFDGGGRLMMDFTDVDAQELRVGLPMRMTFRIKAVDTARGGYPRYFWKASALRTGGLQP